MGRAIRFLLVGLVLLGLVLGFRAATLRSHQIEVDAAPRAVVDEAAAAERLAGGLRFPTVSNADGAGRDDAAFDGFAAYLAATYPLVHASLEREAVGGKTLVYTWRGSDPSLPPVLLLAHQDVVPVEPGTEEDWEHPPFSGAVSDGFVWGRGALDNKANLFGQLEALEGLLQDGVRPKRTAIFVFGHDEEIGGGEGARVVAELLAQRGVRPLLVLDEGGSLLQGVVPGVAAPVAAVGVAEKGYVSVELVAEAPGGHSSTPGKEGAIGILAEALRSLDHRPPKAHLGGVTRQMLEEGVGPAASFPYRLVYANLWLFRPVVEQVLAGIPAASATIRTTTAPTILEAGLKDNVIPNRARAVVNFRILPGDTIDGVVEHVKQAVDDPRVEIEALPKRREASPPSATSGEGWELLARSVREVHPDAVVSPYLMLAGTDSRHFRGLTENVYRFMPLRLELADTKRIHGTNERISVPQYADLIRVYRRFLENSVR